MHLDEKPIISLIRNSIFAHKLEGLEKDLDLDLEALQLEEDAVIERVYPYFLETVNTTPETKQKLLWLSAPESDFDAEFTALAATYASQKQKILEKKLVLRKIITCIEAFHSSIPIFKLFSKAQALFTQKKYLLAVMYLNRLVTKIKENPDLGLGCIILPHTEKMTQTIIRDLHKNINDWHQLTKDTYLTIGERYITASHDSFNLDFKLIMSTHHNLPQLVPQVVKYSSMLKSTLIAAEKIGELSTLVKLYEETSKSALREIFLSCHFPLEGAKDYKSSSSSTSTSTNPSNIPTTTTTATTTPSSSSTPTHLEQRLLIFFKKTIGYAYHQFSNRSFISSYIPSNYYTKLCEDFSTYLNQLVLGTLPKLDQPSILVSLKEHTEQYFASLTQISGHDFTEGRKILFTFKEYYFKLLLTKYENILCVVTSNTWHQYYDKNGVIETLDGPDEIPSDTNALALVDAALDTSPLRTMPILKQLPYPTALAKYLLYTTCSFCKNLNDFDIEIYLIRPDYEFEKSMQASQILLGASLSRVLGRLLAEEDTSLETHYFHFVNRAAYLFRSLEWLSINAGYIHDYLAQVTCISTKYRLEKKALLDAAPVVVTQSSFAILLRKQYPHPLKDAFLQNVQKLESFSIAITRKLVSKYIHADLYNWWGTTEDPAFAQPNPVIVDLTYVLGSVSTHRLTEQGRALAKIIDMTLYPAISEQLLSVVTQHHLGSAQRTFTGPAFLQQLELDLGLLDSLKSAMIAKEENSSAQDDSSATSSDSLTALKSLTTLFTKDDFHNYLDHALRTKHYPCLPTAFVMALLDRLSKKGLFSFLGLSPSQKKYAELLTTLSNEHQ